MPKKIAIITGARRGIGLAISQALASEGYHVVLSAVSSQSDSEEILRWFSENNLSAEYISCDISKEADRTALIEEVCRKYGRIDVLINNAGVAPLVRKDILEMTEESFNRVIDINLKGTFFMSQLVANKMITQQKKMMLDFKPRIVNISSISAYTVSTSRGEYCMSKAGISMATQLFAERLAEYNIPVFEVRPGVILTDMTKKVEEKYRQMIEDGLTPIKRFGYPKDVGESVLVLCSGKLDFSTGQVINVDGGFHIRRL